MNTIKEVYRMKLSGKAAAFAVAATAALYAVSFAACAEGAYLSAPVSAVYSSMDNRESGNDAADGIVMKTGAFDEAANYSLSLTAEADCTECFVGDEFTVMITADNVGGSDLGNLRVYFEDIEVYSGETLAAGQQAQFKITLRADASDIETGGVINISASADELGGPVRTTISVRVMPGEQNPATGSDCSALLLPTASGLAAVVSRKKRR